MEEWNYIKKSLISHDFAQRISLFVDLISYFIFMVYYDNSLTFRFLNSPQTATQKTLNVNIFSFIHTKLYFSLLNSSTQFSPTTVFVLYTKPCSISALKNSTDYLYN